MLLGRLEVGIAVKCSNLTAGLCLFLFTSRWVSFENCCTIFSTAKSMSYRRMAPKFLIIRENCHLFYAEKQSQYISLLQTKAIQSPYPLKVPLPIQHVQSSLLAWNISHFPSTAWSLIFPPGIRLRATNLLYLLLRYRQLSGETSVNQLRLRTLHGDESFEVDKNTSSPSLDTRPSPPLVIEEDSEPRSLSAPVRINRRMR